MTTDLGGKSALVTGGSRGIGAAIARRLAHDGASVAITYASSKAKADEVVTSIERSGGKAMAMLADGRDATTVMRAVDATAGKFGGLDILVNNAGVAPFAPIAELSLEDFDACMNVNVRAVFAACKAALRHMPDGGRIITIGSIMADRMPMPGGSVYGMSKAAVAGLTRGLARDLGPRRITVNTVQPGPIDTDMNPDQGDFAASLKGLMALPRYGKADEIAAIVAFLASQEAAFITGACVNVDGGFGT